MSENTENQGGTSVYSVSPSVFMNMKWITELSQKSGKSLEEWVALVRESGPRVLAERRDWLKERYKLPTMSAWRIAERSLGKGFEDDDPDAYLEAAPRYVDAMFSGAKAGLRPLYNRLLEIGRTLGSDVKVCPATTIVPFYRNRVFAQIKPTTRTRIDLGLALGKTETPARLISTGGLPKGDRITHRIAVMTESDIDDELNQWFQFAHDLDE